jgi:uracil-DNA glycosylase
MPATKGRRALPVIVERLHRAYPDARYELDWETPVQLLVATILAAQSTDQRVNQVTRTLFKKYPDARAFAEADRAELADDLRPTGYYNQKAEAVQLACRALVDRFGGDVPRTMEEMLTLPRVARKTANVVLTMAYGIPSGIIVDTHVARVAPRLGLTDEEKPERIEEALMDIVPQHEWIHFGAAMVLHGRYTCTASNPKCGACVLEDACEKRGVADASGGAARGRAAARAAVRQTTDTDTEDEDESEDEPPMAKARGKSGRAASGRSGSASGKPGSSARPLSAQLGSIPASWRAVLADEFEKPYFQELEAFVAEERRNHTVFPPEDEVFNAFKHTPYDTMKVLLLGQDPYHDEGQAHGLCFSVRPGVRPPPSLVNIFKELHDDLGCKVPNNGYLMPWADRGVLLLNAVLTVRAHEPNSHKDKGWERFTDAAIHAAGERDDPVVFVLWGAYAQKKEKLIDTSRHVIIKSAHPSPLSAKKFFGSKPFSAVNDALVRLGKAPIDWQIPDL